MEQKIKNMIDTYRSLLKPSYIVSLSVSGGWEDKRDAKSELI